MVFTTINSTFGPLTMLNRSWIIECIPKFRWWLVIHPNAFVEMITYQLPECMLAKNGALGQFQNAFENLSFYIGIKHISFRHFVWYFKGYFWNFTQNISLIQWKKLFWFYIKIWTALRFKNTHANFKCIFANFKWTLCGTSPSRHC